MMKTKFEQLQLTGANNKADRRELDFYPTPPEATIALMDFLKLPKDYIIWEPACGDGAMSKILERYVDCVYSSDIREEGVYGDSGVDYLEKIAPFFLNAVITNPPFSLAEEFIKKGLRDASVVAMLLKSQYWHAKKRVPLFVANPPAWVLPLTWRPDFLSGDKGGRPTMEMAWTVWMIGDTVPKYKPLLKPIT